MRNTLPPLEGGYKHAVLSANSCAHLIVFPHLAELPHQLGRVIDVDQVADKTIMTSRYSTPKGVRAFRWCRGYKHGTPSKVLNRSRAGAAATERVRVRPSRY